MLRAVENGRRRRTEWKAGDIVLRNVEKRLGVRSGAKCLEYGCGKDDDDDDDDDIEDDPGETASMRDSLSDDDASKNCSNPSLNEETTLNSIDNHADFHADYHAGGAAFFLTHRAAAVRRHFDAARKRAEDGRARLVDAADAWREFNAIKAVAVALMEDISGQLSWAKEGKLEEVRKKEGEEEEEVRVEEVESVKVGKGDPSKDHRIQRISGRLRKTLEGRHYRAHQPLSGHDQLRMLRQKCDRLKEKTEMLDLLFLSYEDFVDEKRKRTTEETIRRCRRQERKPFQNPCLFDFVVGGRDCCPSGAYKFGGRFPAHRGSGSTRPELVFSGWRRRAGMTSPSKHCRFVPSSPFVAIPSSSPLSRRLILLLLLASGIHPNPGPRQRRHRPPSNRIIGWNCNGIGNSVTELRNFVSRNNVLVACIQESKLKPGSKHPSFPDFVVEHLDRAGGGRRPSHSHSSFRRIPASSSSNQ